MQIKSLAGWLTILALAWPLAAYANQTEVDQDQKSAKKYAVLWLDDIWEAKGRGLCACLSHPTLPEFEGKLGVLRLRRETETIGSVDYSMIAVQCVPFAYDQSTGERDRMIFCESWVPLAK